MVDHPLKTSRPAGDQDIADDSRARGCRLCGCFGRSAPTLLSGEGRASTLVLEPQRPMEVGNPQVIIRLKVVLCNLFTLRDAVFLASSRSRNMATACAPVRVHLCGGPDDACNRASPCCELGDRVRSGSAVGRLSDLQPAWPPPASMASSSQHGQLHPAPGSPACPASSSQTRPAQPARPRSLSSG